VSALDPITGEERWVADNSGRAIRYGPAVAADRLIVVDQQGYLSAYALADGKRLWQSLEFDYLGAPLLAGDRVLVAASGAVAREVGLEGRRIRAWSMTNASDVADTNPRLDFGPVAGGGAIWTVDSRSVVRRIGGSTEGPEHLRLDWVRQVNEPPFDMDLLRASPILRGDTVLVADEGGRVVELDVETGAPRLLFRSNVEASRVEPVLAGDLLILTTGNGMTALRMAEGSEAWKASGGTAVRPPVVTADTVVWSAALPDGTGARLMALSASAGEARWTRDFAGIAVPGGLTADGDAVYASAPVARFNVATGETVWEAPELTGGTGSPTLAPDGRVLYVGRLDPVAGGEVVALSSETGAILWRSPLGQSALSLLERPWVSGDTLLIPTLDGLALGLDAQTGAIRWQASLPAARFGAVTVADGRAYMALMNGQVVALSVEDGRIAARGGDREGGLEGYAFAQRPLLAGGRVVVSFGSSLRGFSLAEASP
jgi:outer membrane protein assembly factor BamB